MKQSFYKCNHCGKIIAIVKETGVPVFCCGEPMKEIIAGSTDAAQEKHVPVVTINGNNVVVNVGSAQHPMTAEHSIEWISIQTKQGNQRKALSPEDKPEARFAITDGDEVVAVYAYCNIHGLWKTDIANKAACDISSKPLANGDYIVCKCNNVSYLDIVNELHKHNNIDDLLRAFENVKNITHCSTGCGGCYDKVIAILSDEMN